MADSFAQVSDVGTMLAPATIEGSEIPKVGGLLRRASMIIRSQVWMVDQRIAEGTLDPQAVSDVAVDIVLRYLRNEEGIKQETIGPIATTYDPLVAAGRLFLDPGELFLLQPPQAAKATVGTMHTVPALTPRHDRRLERQFDPRSARGRRRL